MLVENRGFLCWTHKVDLPTRPGNGPHSYVRDLLYCGQTITLTHDICPQMAKSHNWKPSSAVREHTRAAWGGRGRGDGLEQADEAVRGCCGPTAGKMPWAGRGREEEEGVRKEGT